MKLVFLQNNRPVTDSQTVSETFGKRHADVLRSIENLDCSKDFNERNFALVDYKDAKGEIRPKYLITQDGFSFLAFGYTGKEAARYKEMYIAEFNRMREELNKPQFALPQNYVQALEALVVAEKDKEVLQLQNAYKDEQLKLQEPKVALYDVAMQANNVQPVGTVAKELGLGRTRLFAILRDKKVLRENNEPYQEYIERGYFKLRMYTITHKSSGLENKTQPMVTAKGMAWIQKILKEA